MRKLWTAFLMMLPCLVTQGGEKCQEVGGAISANLLHEKGDIIFSTNGNPGTNSVSFVDVALATATGDLLLASARPTRGCPPPWHNC